MLAILISAVFFACSAWLGVLVSRLVCSGIEPLDGAPQPGEPPVAWLIAGSAAVGGALAARGVPPLELALAAVICLALVGCWCSDMVCGIVPDLFTLAPLVAIAITAVARGSWWLVLSGLVPFVPFALAAAFSKGRGMGWGDAKLVALGGMVLGLPTAILAFALACIAAVLVYRAKGIKSGPIAFAPYLAAAIGLAIPIGTFV